MCYSVNIFFIKKKKTKRSHRFRLESARVQRVKLRYINVIELCYVFYIK